MKEFCRGIPRDIAELPDGTLEESPWDFLEKSLETFVEQFGKEYLEESLEKFVESIWIMPG